MPWVYRDTKEEAEREEIPPDKKECQITDVEKMIKLENYHVATINIVALFRQWSLLWLTNESKEWNVVI